ncbi:MAG: hypothetical protein WKG01_28405 [Kofleriaceae bacterium]
MKKLTLLLTFVSIAALGACSKKNGATTPSPAPVADPATPAADPAAADPATPADPAAPAAGADPCAGPSK